VIQENPLLPAEEAGEWLTDSGDVADATPAIERRFDSLLASDPSRALAAARTLSGELATKNVRFGEGLLPTSIKPHFLARSINDRWIRNLGRFVNLLESAAKYFISDETLRSGPLFSREAWDLFDIDPGYGRFAVVCRPDMAWVNSRAALLEMNADSPAMMVYADHVQEIQRGLFPFAELDRPGAVGFHRRTPDLLRALLDTYREWGGTKSSPTVAILDWPGQKTEPEQHQLALDLTELGCPALVCCPADLEVRGGRLLARGEPIDIVQRRLLFPDIVRRRDELAPFLTAYRERLACVINPLRSYLLGCKALLATARTNGWYSSLGEADRELLASILPATLPIGPHSWKELQDRTRWVIKPAFGSGGKGVVIGRFADDTAWTRALAGASDGRWIAQAYVPIPTYSAPILSDGQVVIKRLYANWNPFFFDGRFSGAITRVSNEPVVGISAGGALLPAVLAMDE
jgi:uncharacterized circularly permuted ATP-grasp superfamily protein